MSHHIRPQPSIRTGALTAVLRSLVSALQTLGKQGNLAAERAIGKGSQLSSTSEGNACESLRQPFEEVTGHIPRTRLLHMAW